MFGIALLQNSSNSTKKNSAKHHNSKTPWSNQLHGAVVQMKLEFWSISLAAIKQPLLNLLVELVVYYPPMTLVTQKITFQSILSEPPPTPPFLSPAARRCPAPPLSPPLAQDGGAAAAGGCPGERRELGAASAPSGRCCSHVRPWVPHCRAVRGQTTKAPSAASERSTG